MKKNLYLSKFQGYFLTPTAKSAQHHLHRFCLPSLILLSCSITFSKCCFGKYQLMSTFLFIQCMETFKWRNGIERNVAIIYKRIQPLSLCKSIHFTFSDHCFWDLGRGGKTMGRCKFPIH